MFSNNSHARLPLGCNPSEKQRKLVTLPRCRYGVQLSAVDVERGLGCDVLVRRIKTTFFHRYFTLACSNLNGDYFFIV